MDVSKLWERDHLGQFCEDVFISLDANIKCYDPNKHEFPLFLYKLRDDAYRTRSHFSPEMEKAVHTFAYLYRRECCERCHQKFSLPKIISTKSLSDFTFERDESFGTFIGKLTILEDNYYLRLLAWIGFVYEQTVICSMKARFSFARMSWGRLQRYMENEYFKNEEQWKKFSEIANRVAFFYDPLVRSVRDNFPERGILAPFQYALKETLRLNQYKLNMTKLRMFRDSDNRKQCSKFECLWEYNPQQIIFGHTVFRKKKSADNPRMIPKRTAILSKRVLKASGAQRGPDVYMDNVMCGPSTSSAASTWNVSGSETSADKEYSEVDAYENPVFVISKRYYNRLVTHTDNLQARSKKYFKIYSPAKERLEKVENLNSILEDNIRNRKVKTKSEIPFVYIGERDDINNNKIIVVDSSSETEDDEEFDTCQRSFIANALRSWKDFSLDDIEMMSFVLESRFWE